MYIRTGTIMLKSQRITTTATWVVVKETEKALQIRETVTITRNRNSSVASQDERTYWLPKSQIARHGDFIHIPDWLAQEKGVLFLDVQLVSANGQTTTTETMAKALEAGEAYVSIGPDVYYHPAVSAETVNHYYFLEEVE